MPGVSVMKCSLVVVLAALFCQACVGASSSSASRCAAIPRPAPDGTEAEPGFNIRPVLVGDNAEAIARNVGKIKPGWEEVELAMMYGGDAAKGRCPGFRVLRYYAQNGLLDPEVHYSKTDGLTPLHGQKNPVIAKELLDAGYSPHARLRGESPEAGFTPLRYLLIGIENGAGDTPAGLAEILQTAQLLLDAGASPNADSISGDTPYTHARWLISQGDKGAREMASLFEANGGIDSDDRFVKLDVLLWAAIEVEDPEAVEAAMEQGASPFLPRPHQLEVSPLRAAVRSGNSKVVEALLKHGAEPNELSGEGSARISILDEVGRSPKSKANASILRRTLESHGAESTAVLVRRDEWLAERRAKRAEAVARYNARQAHFKELMANAAAERARAEAEWQERQRQANAQQKKAYPSRVERINMIIDAVNRGVGNKVYMRLDRSGKYVWVQRD